MKRLVSIALYILSLFVIVQQFVYPANIAMHFAPQAADSGPSGLVAHWKFDEGSGSTTADSSGNGNTGTISGATWTTSGKYDDALDFDGTNDRVNVSDDDSLDLTTGLTIAAWVNRGTAGDEYETVVFKNNSGNSDLVYLMYSESNTNQPGIWVNSSNFCKGTGLSTGTWIHLAVTYDGSNLKVFEGGTQVGESCSYTTAINTSTGQLSIGGNSIWGEYFDGIIDDVRIYNRALSASEIQSIM